MDEFKYLGVNHPKQCTGCKMDEEERAGRLVLVETTFSGDLGQKDSSKSEGYDVQDDSESETQLKMLRSSLGATRMYRIRN